jgi:hypothetical protein
MVENTLQPAGWQKLFFLLINVLFDRVLRAFDILTLCGAARWGRFKPVTSFLLRKRPWRLAAVTSGLPVLPLF